MIQRELKGPSNGKEPQTKPPQGKAFSGYGPLTGTEHGDLGVLVEKFAPRTKTAPMIPLGFLGC